MFLPQPKIKILFFLKLRNRKLDIILFLLELNVPLKLIGCRSVSRIKIPFHQTYLTKFWLCFLNLYSLHDNWWCCNVEVSKKAALTKPFLQYNLPSLIWYKTSLDALPRAILMALTKCFTQLSLLANFNMHDNEKCVVFFFVYFNNREKNRLLVFYNWSSAKLGKTQSGTPQWSIAWVDCHMCS